MVGGEEVRLAHSAEAEEGRSKSILPGEPPSPYMLPQVLIYGCEVTFPDGGLRVIGQKLGD
jgi:hypothetical protein